MNRLALKRLLNGLIVAALPLPLGGCPLGTCGEPTAHNELAPLPQGGILRAGKPAPRDTPLTESECAVPCGWGTDLGGFDSTTLRVDLPHECRIVGAGDGGEQVFCQYFTSFHCVGGRRPQGLAASEGRYADPVGELLARMAHLEAASVPAFARLEQELRGHGAPARLRAAARRALADEVRHARTMTALARRHGAEPPPVHIDEATPRGLLAMAIENAVEGCVGETWGATVAGYQARAAGDRRIARALARIAADEAEHAELAWAVDRWARSRLSDDERRQLDAARRGAGRELALREGEGAEVGEALLRDAGYPPREARRTLLAGLREALWS